MRLSALGYLISNARQLAEPALAKAAPATATASSWDRLTASVRGALHYVAAHTGLPIVLVAAVALVVSWHFFKRSARFLLQVGAVLVLLVIATGLGWISW